MISTISHAMLIDFYIGDYLSDDINSSEVLIPLAPPKLEDEIRLDLGLQISEAFINENLYFRNNLEKDLFLESSSIILTNLLKSEEFTLKSDKMVESIRDRSVEIVYKANEVIDIYYQLKSCQIDKKISLDPLSSVVANIIIQALPSFKNATVDGVLRYLVYTHYKEYIVNGAKSIYQERLDECNEYNGIHYVERDHNGENEISEDNSELATGSEELEFIGGQAASA